MVSKEYRKEHYQENKEKELEVNKKYRENNKRKISKINSKYYDKRKKYYKDKSKERYENNKELRKKQNLEYYHKMYKSNEGFRMRRLLGTALSRVIRYYIKTSKIANPMRKYHIDWKGIMEVLTPIPQPRKDYNVDHIIPLCRFDLTDFKQIHLAFAPENHRWMLAKDNRRRDRKNK